MGNPIIEFLERSLGIFVIYFDYLEFEISEFSDLEIGQFFFEFELNSFDQIFKVFQGNQLESILSLNRFSYSWF